MYEKLAVSIIIIFLVILLLLFIALDNKKVVGQQGSTGTSSVQPTVSNQPSTVSIETITIATPPTIIRLASTAMNLQLNVLGSGKPTGVPGVGGRLYVPALPNSQGRIIRITNVSAEPILEVFDLGVGVAVIFPRTEIPVGQSVTFKAIRDNEYVKV